MGLKLRLGLAGLGLALSSMFGVNMLSGVKDYVDTTGNIMVDIADGIGMVSKVKRTNKIQIKGLTWLLTCRV